MNTNAAPEWLPSFAVPFFTLSYPTPPPAVPDSFPNSSYYGTGLLDGCWIVTCIAVMAVLRDAFRLLVFEPFAKWKLTRDLQRRHSQSKPVANGNGHANGVSKTNGAANGMANGNGHGNATSVGAISKREQRVLHRSVLRFAEQGWSFIYYSAQWSFDVWINYPHIPLAGPVKFYYLIQTAFYMHQVLILNAEARRKDHWQMMTHHIVTVALMVGSYFYNYTRVGMLIMLLMDTADFLFPLAKMLRYLSYSTLCDAIFALFMISWFATRHALFSLVILSAWKDSLRHIPFAWDPQRGLYLTPRLHKIFNGMLISLEILQLVWFVMIVRVAWRVISGQGASDERSDDEDGFDDDDEDEDKKNQ